MSRFSPNRKELGLGAPNSQPHVHTFHSELGISSLENPRLSSLLSPECLPHCVTWTWGSAHHVAFRLFPAFRKVSCAWQAPGLVDGRLTNEQLHPSRPAPAIPAPTNLLEHPGMTQYWDLCVYPTFSKPWTVVHAWELILGVGARPSCWQESGHIADMSVPVHVWSCVSGGWYPGLARCPKLIVGFNCDGGEGAGVTDETLTS